MGQASDQQKSLAGAENEKAKFERFDINVSPPCVIPITLRLGHL